VPLTTRSLPELRDLARRLLRNLLPELDSYEGTDLDRLGRALASMFLGTQGQIAYAQRARFPSSAGVDELLRHGAARSLFRKGASSASGLVLAVGSDPTVLPVVPPFQTLTSPTGIEYVNPFSSSAAWSSGTPVVLLGSGLERLLVSDVTGLVVDSLVSIGGQLAVIRTVDATLSIVDLYVPLAVPVPEGTAILPASGALVSVGATTSGRAGNVTPLEELTPSSPIAGVDRFLAISIDGGADIEELDTSFRARLVAEWASPATYGSIGWYRRTAASVEGVEDAAVYANFGGAGVHYIVPIGPPGFRRVGTATRQAVVDAIADSDGPPPADTPIVDQGTIQAIGDAPEVTVEIATETGFEPDFVDSVGMRIQPGSTTLELIVDRVPSTLERGDRVLISQRYATGWQLLERTVGSIDAPALRIELEEALPVAALTHPSGQVDVRTSGPNALEILAALEGVFDELGPSVTTGATEYERLPAPSDLYDPVLRVARLYGATEDLPGVRNVELVSIDGASPADVTPAAALTWTRRGEITIRLT
jgi:hypothetical protein